MPPGSQLHPNLRGIKPTVVKRVLGEAKDHGWRTEGGTGYGVHERSFHTAGIIIVSSKGMWLCKRKYNGIPVWSDVFARKTPGDEPAWKTATRALYNHAYAHVNPANGQMVCYTTNNTKCVCYILPMPQGVEWPEPDNNAQ